MRIIKNYDAALKLVVENVKNILLESATFDEDEQLENELLLFFDALKGKNKTIKAYTKALVSAEIKNSYSVDVRNLTAETNIGLADANHTLKELNLSLHNQNQGLILESQRRKIFECAHLFEVLDGQPGIASAA